MSVENRRKQTANTAPSQPQITKPSRPIAPLWQVAISGFSTMPLVTWCVIWAILTLFIDVSQLHYCIRYHTFAFLMPFLLPFLGIVFLEIVGLGRKTVLPDISPIVTTVCSMAGIILTLIIFRVVFYPILAGHVDTTAFMPNVVTAINDGV